MDTATDMITADYLAFLMSIIMRYLNCLMKCTRIEEGLKSLSNMNSLNKCFYEWFGV